MGAARQCQIVIVQGSNNTTYLLWNVDDEEAESDRHCKRIKQYNSLPVGAATTRQSQIDIVRGSNKITYVLCARQRVASVLNRTSIKQGHIPPEGEARKTQGQNDIVKGSNKITYVLWCHISIAEAIRGDHIHSVSENTVESDLYCENIKCDHILPVGEAMTRYSDQHFPGIKQYNIHPV